MEEIVKVHFGDIDKKLCENALNAFYEIRKLLYEKVYQCPVSDV
jgi:hypothetical protein